MQPRRPIRPDRTA